MARGNLAKHGKKNKAATLNVNKPTNNNVTEPNTDNSTSNSTEESTDITNLLRQKLAPGKKKVEKKQISAWVEKDVYDVFMKYKGNGDRGQKSELINKLLKIAFNMEEE